VKVVLLVLDAQPHRHVSPEVTPVLAGLAAAGGRAPSGGRAVLTSATYPNHASFVTGTDAVGHGLYANHVVRDGRVRRAYDVGPSAPTLFDACRDAGRTAVAVFGDHHLVPVMGAGSAASHWPQDGALPAGRRLDDYGYLHDAETIVPLCAAAAAPLDLLVSQLNGPDTAAHLHGPDSADAVAIYTQTDGFVGELVEALQPAWNDTVLLVVSDHDQTTVSDAEPIDLQAAARAAGVEATIVLEGDGAVVVGDDRLQGSWLRGVDGLGGTEELAPGLRFVSAEPGRWFAPAGAEVELKGVHGGLATRTQVAIVAGGHAAVPRLAAGLARRVPEAPDWAVTIAELLDLDLPTATGRSLLA
jgi:type I phosphodiesterase/nucleotide pyrophosphatase